MLDMVLERVRALATEMRTKATERRQLHPVDAAADTCVFWALRVEALVEELAAGAETLSPEQYAALHGVSPQSVRNWSRAGELAATRGADGHWRIPRGAVRVRRIGTRAAAASIASADVALSHAS